jgi:hypothetical protein
MTDRVKVHLEREAAVESAFERGDFETIHDTVAEMDLTLSGVWVAVRDRLTLGEVTEMTVNQFVDTLLTANPDYFDGKKDVDFNHGREVGHVLGLLGRLDIIDKLLDPGQGETTDGAYTAAGIVQGLGHTANEIGFDHVRTRITHFPERYRQGIEAQFAQGLPAKM